MSLINDALRKARQAAAEHDEQHLRTRPPLAYPSRGRRRGLGLLTVASLTIASAVAGAAAVWWLGSRTATDVPTVQAAAPALPTTPGPAARQSAATPATPVAAGRESPTPAPRTTAGHVPPQRTADNLAESAASLTAEPGTPSGPAADEHGSTGPIPAATGERVFILDAAVGGVTLSLDFIVARPVRPFAEINGVEVYEGSEIEGFTVEKIEADQVTLRDGEGPLVLKVR